MLAITTIIHENCFSFGLALSVLLSACATHPHPREETLREQLSQVDWFWEIPRDGRARWMNEHSSKDTSETYLSLPEEGAQCALTCVRLEKDVLAIVASTGIMDGSSRLHIMKKTADGWTEITPTAFPYTLTGRLESVAVHADKSLTVQPPESTTVERYRWNGAMFVRAE